MHLFFVDESGTPPKPSGKGSAYFVVGGVIIPEGVWHRIHKKMMGLKIKHKIRGEIKWRYFAPNNTDDRNPMRNLSQDKRDEVRDDVFKIITTERSLKLIATIGSAEAAYKLGNINTQEDLYHGTFKPSTERFQYYLQGLTKQSGTRQLGIVVSDHRGQQDDARLRRHHQKLLHSTAETISRYDNLVEGLFLEPSNLSVGIQLADMVAGAVWRQFERNDDRWFREILPSFRAGPKGDVWGYGLVKFPKAGWK